ncbi:II/X family phage/plasmid replication protein [Idiomarina aquatica]|uniref:II/X family phage/plasmid replication protein n=1 Tax=Idiomarina aquatica TaxID=1327752 RepID=A0A4R6PRF6_9GAMM|nr:phage/plasmid replication protein, II/X family [Idiomarina aquatica]TDP40701.1 II/X family phage/plasmid replication protein [Idiomarina aquatica]
MSVMIDWITAVIPMKHKIINSGHFIELTPDGECLNEFAKRKRVKGSFCSSISIKTNNVRFNKDGIHEYGEQLYIDGNPAKFLQGHNCFGSNDVSFLLSEMVRQAFSSLDVELTDMALASILHGNFEVKRIDITAMYELPSASDVDAWIYALSNSAKSRHGLPELTDRTLYFGKRSRRYATKIYSKFRELQSGRKEHALPNHLVNTPLLGWTANKVRIEHVLRAPELKKQAQNLFNRDALFGKDLKPDLINKLFTEYLGRIEMSGQMTATDKQLHSIDTKLRGTYELWRQGLDIRSMMSKATFYRHRAELKEQLNIDIALPPKQAQSNVIPLLRPLEAKPASVPAELSQYQLTNEVKQYATG